MQTNGRLLWGIILITYSFSTTALIAGNNHYPWGYVQQSPEQQKAEAMNSLAETIGKIRAQMANIQVAPGDTTSDNAKLRKSYELALKQLIAKLSDPEKFQQKLGRAMVQGFAGSEAGLYRDVQVENFWDGMWLGLGISSAQATSKVVGKHVGDTADLLIGGLWDSFITKLIEGTKLVRDGLFHGGHSAFRGAEVVGISKMVNTTFVNLNTMLRDGLKDMLRGQDMTLRLAEDQQETNHRTLGWRMLVGAYVRQIDYIITLIQLRLPYYDKHDQIVFFAEEIVRCLEDVKRILTDAKNVRELDERLDSNKNLINAMKANIANLFERLQELVEPTAPKKNTYASTMPKPGRATGHDDYYEKDTFPHPMHG
ncbi:hypothetical protein FJ365_03055 [Candidatus Dependentiae bacterium]|nr:hypothetical protein [Candidatus Dependentiae bacterium]